MLRIILMFLALTPSIFAQSRLVGKLKDEIRLIDYKYPVKLSNLKSITYNNTNFLRELYFIKPDNDTSLMFNNSVLFENNKFTDGITFRKCEFKNKFSLINNDFYGIFILTSSKFDSSIIIRKMSFFASSSSCIDNKFSGVDSIDNNSFAEPIDFSKTQSSNIFNFSNNYINNSLHFRNSSFNKTEFSDNVFNGFTDFSHSTFKNTTSFFQSKFNNQVNFYNCIFNNRLDFRYASFIGTVHFNYSTLPDTLDLRNIEKISQELDFTYCNLGSSKGKCKIALYGSDISKIKINLKLFELIFPSSDDSYEARTSVYERLLSKFKTEGFTEDYKELFIEYEEFKTKYSSWLSFLPNTIGDYLNNIWWKYGYEPARIIGFTFGFLFLFTLINSMFLDKLNKNVYEIEVIERGMRENPEKKKMFFSFVYTSLIFFGFKLNVDKLKKISFCTIYIFGIYTIGLLCILFLARIIIK